MKRFSTILALATVVSFAQFTPASAMIDKIAKVDAGTTYSWEGAKVPGTNENYFGNNTPVTPVTPAGTCTKDPNTYCEIYLFKLSNPITDAEAAAGVVRKTSKVKIDLAWEGTPVLWDNASTNLTDFDLVVFASDDLGTQGDELAESAQGDTISETAQFEVTTTPSTPAVWVLAHVVYWQVPNADGYSGSAKLTQFKTFTS